MTAITEAADRLEAAYREVPHPFYRQFYEDIHTVIAAARERDDAARWYEGFDYADEHKDDMYARERNPHVERPAA